MFVDTTWSAVNEFPGHFWRVTKCLPTAKHWVLSTDRMILLSFLVLCRPLGPGFAGYLSSLWDLPNWLMSFQNWLPKHSLLSKQMSYGGSDLQFQAMWKLPHGVISTRLVTVCDGTFSYLFRMCQLDIYALGTTGSPVGSCCYIHALRDLESVVFPCCQCTGVTISEFFWVRRKQY